MEKLPEIATSWVITIAKNYLVFKDFWIVAI